MLKKILVVFLLVNFIYIPKNEVISQNLKNKKLNIESYRCVVFDRDSKRNLYGKNENIIGAMASTTKIMTAIIVLENSKLDDEVSVSKRASQIGGSRVGLKYNDKINVRDLLYALMLRSGNDSAIALAEHVGGSVEKFVILMNQKNKKLGLLKTNFTSPHGLDNKNHYTTASELAKITDYALSNKTFSKIVGTKYAKIKINNKYKEITNTNELLGAINGVVGVKTGFTNGAGRCLVTEAKRNDMDIIIVVLGAKAKKDRTDDSIKLINYIFDNYKSVDIKDKINQIINEFQKNTEIHIIKSENRYIDIILGRTKFNKCIIKKDGLEQLKYKIDILPILEAPIEVGERIGTLKIYNGNELLQNIEIINKNYVFRKDIIYYIKFIMKSFIFNLP